MVAGQPARRAEVEGLDGVGVHEVLGSWTADELTWANSPEVVEDPEIVFSASPGTFAVGLDGLVEGWFVSGQNEGLCLQTLAPELTDLYASESGEGPVLRIEMTW